MQKCTKNPRGIGCKWVAVVGKTTYRKAGLITILSPLVQLCLRHPSEPVPTHSVVPRKTGPYYAVCTNFERVFQNWGLGANRPGRTPLSNWKSICNPVFSEAVHDPVAVSVPRGVPGDWIQSLRLYTRAGA